MKITSFTAALFAIGAAAIEHPDIPKEKAVVNVKVDDSKVLIYANKNTTKTEEEIEVFAAGPGLDPKTFNETHINAIAISVLVALDQKNDEPAAPQKRQEQPGATAQEDGEPKITVWVEEAAKDQTEKTYDIFLSGPDVKEGEVTDDQYVDIVLALFNLGDEVEAGKAPRPGPYVPGSSIGRVGSGGFRGN